MTKKVFSFFVMLVLVLAGIVWSASEQTVQARDPQAVELMYFIAEGVEDGVQLDWRTATEFGTAAFRMKRASSAAGPFAYIDVWQNGNQINVIPVQNPDFPETGGIYSVEDRAAATGQTYWYTLVEVELSGSEIELETLSVVAGAGPTPTPTATGQVIGGGGTTTTTTTTPTATVTQPAAATATTAPSQNTPVPTAISQPTAVPTRDNSTSPGGSTTTGNTGSNGSGSSTSSGSNTTTTNNGSAGTASQPIAQITATPAEGYPGAEAPGEGGDARAPETPAVTAAAYPEGQPTTAFDPNATPYPLQEAPPTNNSNEPYQGGTPPITDFGNEVPPATNGTLPAPVQNTTTASSTGGRVVLWVGFLGGLLIFAAGVFGTILLFTRKQNGPQ